MIWLVVVHIRGRSRLGALAPALHKYEVQFVAGCEEEAIRERFAGRPNTLLTLADWTPAAAPEEGVVVLPDTVRAGLLEIGGAPPEDGFDMVILNPGGAITGEGRLRASQLGEPLRVGCLYAVSPPGVG